MIRLLIADDHQFLLDGFSSIVDSLDDMMIAATASNGKQVLSILENQDIDVVLLDINMPVLNGVETCKKIQKLYPSLKVIALSMHKKPSFIKRMIQYGAKGYILKDDPSSEIINGIRLVDEDGVYFSRRVNDIALSLSIPQGSDLNNISDREIEVLQLISQGLTNHEIADQLHLSPHTTESHRRHLLTKLDARNTAELVRKGMEKGLI